MIPKIIHQTWHSPTYTENNGSPESWQRLNPDWEYRLWLDDDLEEFVRQEYPDFLYLYQTYPNPVQRADLGRYMLLHHFGGIYADMDTDCLASLDPIVEEDRVILCEEPRLHWDRIEPIGMEAFYFNGTMASPAGHPFWQHVIDCAYRCRHVSYKSELDSTGPLMMSGAVLSWPEQADLSLNSSHLFCQIDRDGNKVTDDLFGDHAALEISRHNWAGTWYTTSKMRWSSKVKGQLRRLRSWVNRPATLTYKNAAKSIDRDLLLSPLPHFDPNDPPHVAICVPVRDGALFLERNIQLIRALDYPLDRIHLIYCEGGSHDNTREVLKRIKKYHGKFFASFGIIEHGDGTSVTRGERTKPQLQLQRRGGIARARNHLLDNGLKQNHEWALWLDVDVCDFAPSILRTLLETQAKIVTPNCVIEYGGGSFDLNAYLEIGKPPPHVYYKRIIDGLYQPPIYCQNRNHLHGMKYVDSVPLTAVGGTMLLVHGSVHRAGLNFPDRPYRHLIETEAFGRLAGDLGLTPIGLPNVEIRHVSS